MAWCILILLCLNIHFVLLFVEFKMKVYWNFSKTLSVFNELIVWFILSVCLCSKLYWFNFYILNNHFIFAVEPYWTWWMMINMLLDLVCHFILIEYFFFICVHKENWSAIPFLCLRSSIGLMMATPMKLWGEWLKELNRMADQLC